MRACGQVSRIFETDCVMIETHPNPKTTLKDGMQSLTFSDFRRLTGELKPLVEALGRTM